MKTIKNEELRNRIEKSGFFYWQVASAVGVHESTFTKWLREELEATDTKYIRIIEAIKQLKAKKKNVV